VRRTNNGAVPREVGDDPCGGVIDYFAIHTSLRVNIVTKFHQAMEDINGKMMTLPRHVRTNYDDLGVKYLVNDITKEQWKKTLKARVKQDEKDVNLYYIYNMFVNVMNDLFRNMLEDRNVENFKTHAYNLSDYTNNQIEKLNDRYKSKNKSVFITIRTDV
jgi:hypothetical protein